MSFYTLTFKRKILLSLILVFTGIVLIDFALYLYASSHTTRDYFINNKFSKIKHFELNNTINKDIIFIGSSRTFYHISTEIFKSNNIDIYNFGISGAGLEDYPTVIPKVIESQPKKVVISLPVPKLFEEMVISQYTSPTLEEMKYYYDIDKIKFFKSLYIWAINRHVFLAYSESIFYKIKSFYSKFDPIKVNVVAKNDNNKDLNYSKLVGCNVFDIKQISDNHQTLKCNNGDGVLIGISQPDKKNNVNNDLSDLNQDTISFLSRMIKEIKDNNIDIDIILEPIVNSQYHYDLENIKRNTEGARIIDLTNYSLNSNLWVGGHLNYKGRNQYSQYLTSIYSDN
jgi:hypothetical protein